jgi:hypothetical protein
MTPSGVHPVLLAWLKVWTHLYYSSSLNQSAILAEISEDTKADLP